MAAGIVATAAGWGWATLLVAYFVTTTGLTRVGRRAKEARTGDVVAKGGARDWRQVAANGGVFAFAAAWAAIGLNDGAAIAALGVGSLAAAAADSWGTEVGTLSARPPRSILTLKRVPPGTSGGVSLPGTIALVAGAAFIAALALLAGFPGGVVRAAAAGGVFGALVDSVLGATLQARRWCPACARATEQPVHRCGAESVQRGGVAWLDNDAVNFACALSGGLLAAALAG
jgi:uncharacterized protein (TIGR00297 family)